MTDGPWIINVAGRAYGPYSAEQMRAFAREGRVVAASLVARAGDTDFREAAQEPSLAQLFKSARPSTLAEALQHREPKRQPTFGRQDDNERGSRRELAHLVVMADMKSRSISGLEEEMHKLGVTVQLLPQVWLLSSEATANAVRNILIQQLGKLDMLFVLDASRDKAAWFNFGPELDTRIRRFWAKPGSDAK
jgi:hypothetical protein